MISDLAIAEPAFEHPNLKDHGDWSTNIAMAIAAKSKGNPRQTAQAIIDNIVPDSRYLRHVEIAGPGFINFFLCKDWLYTVLEEVESRRDDYGRLTRSKPESIQVEFVSRQSGRAYAYRPWSLGGIRRYPS